MTRDAAGMMLNDFDPPPIGFRHVYRCRYCRGLVHTAEARDDEGRELILRTHLTLICANAPRVKRS